MRLLFRRALVLLPILSIVLFNMGYFGDGKDGGVLIPIITCALFLMAFMWDLICDSGHEVFIVLVLRKTKTLYSEYGTFYISPFGDNYCLFTMKWYGYTVIETYKKKELNEGFINNINSDIKSYCESNDIQNKFDENVKKSMDDWDGILSDRIRRNKKIDSVI